MDIYDALAAFAGYGLQPKYKEMKNGESRFSITLPDGSAWILTQGAADGGWQNAHYHEGWYETYAVASGCVVVATVQDEATGRISMRIVEEGSGFCFAPGQAHNIYLLAGAVIHTVKVGIPVGNPDKKGNDWWPAESLDEYCKRFTSEAAVLAAAGMLV